MRVLLAGLWTRRGMNATGVLVCVIAVAAAVLGPMYGRGVGRAPARHAAGRACAVHHGAVVHGRRGRRHRPPARRPGALHATVGRGPPRPGRGALRRPGRAALLARGDLLGAGHRRHLPARRGHARRADLLARGHVRPREGGRQLPAEARRGADAGHDGRHAEAAGRGHLRRRLLRLLPGEDQGRRQRARGTTPPDGDLHARRDLHGPGPVVAGVVRPVAVHRAGQPGAAPVARHRRDADRSRAPRRPVVDGVPDVPGRVGPADRPGGRRPREHGPGRGHGPGLHEHRDRPGAGRRGPPGPRRPLGRGPGPDRAHPAVAGDGGGPRTTRAADPAPAVRTRLHRGAGAPAARGAGQAARALPHPGAEVRAVRAVPGRGDRRSHRCRHRGRRPRT